MLFRSVRDSCGIRWRYGGKVPSKSLVVVVLVSVWKPANLSLDVAGASATFIFLALVKALVVSSKVRDLISATASVFGLAGLKFNSLTAKR